VYVVADHVLAENDAQMESREATEQLSLFTDYAALEEQQKQEEAALVKEKRVQKAMLNIKRKFGKNSILKGMNYEDGATAKARNRTIGRYRA